jgi:hypothetical protein
MASQTFLRPNSIPSMRCIIPPKGAKPFPPPPTGPPVTKFVILGAVKNPAFCLCFCLAVAFALPLFFAFLSGFGRNDAFFQVAGEEQTTATQPQPTNLPILP